MRDLAYYNLNVRPTCALYAAGISISWRSHNALTAETGTGLSLLFVFLVCVQTTTAMYKPFSFTGKEGRVEYTFFPTVRPRYLQTRVLYRVKTGFVKNHPRSPLHKP